MTDKEFKRLSRSELIDVIYQLQLKQDALLADNEKLSKALIDKRILVSNSGNIAEAALELHSVMQAAQNAATHYLQEIQIRVDAEYDRIIAAAGNEAAAIIERAQKEAAELTARKQQEASALVVKARQEALSILTKARQEAAEVLDDTPPMDVRYDTVVEAILDEYKSGMWNTGEDK